MNLPLSGIKVIELSNYVAAPSASRLLVDLGAEVIKIEAQGGDAWRRVGNSITRRGDAENPIFDILNMGKQSICLNIKDEKGMEILMRMLEDADVFITNTRAKSLVKLGLDGKTLTEKFPRLIYCSLDGYGSKGPDADTPGFDGLAFWSRSGFLVDMAEADGGHPVTGPTGIGDCVTGSFLMGGIMTALYNREKTGRGDIVQTSLYSAAIWVMNSMVLQTQPKYGSVYPRSRSRLNPMTGIYQCRDGNWFKMGVLDYNKDALKVYEVLGVSEQVKAMGVVDAATKGQHNAELLALFREVFATKDAAEWENIFKENDLVAGIMHHFRDVCVDEQAWANDFLEEYRFRSGETCAMPRTPIRMASIPFIPSPQSPLPGEQTDNVLRLYGYSEEDILALRERGTVG